MFSAGGMSMGHCFLVNNANTRDISNDISHVVD